MAARLPGDLIVLPIGDALNLTRGLVVVSCYGALDTMELGQDESVVVDSGHLVAFDPNIAFTARKASSGLMNTIKSGEGFVLVEQVTAGVDMQAAQKLAAKVKSGEGFVLEFSGPGTIHTQTRNPDALVTWLTEVLPFSRS